MKETKDENRTVTEPCRQLLNAVKENTPSGTTSLRVNYHSGEAVKFETDHGDLMRTLLAHYDSRPKEIRVITPGGQILRLQPNEYYEGRVTAVKVEFDPDSLHAIDSELWGEFTDLVARTLRDVGVTGKGAFSGDSIVGVEEFRSPPEDGQGEMTNG